MGFVAKLKRSFITPDEQVLATYLDKTGNLGDEEVEVNPDTGEYFTSTNEEGYGADNGVIKADYARVLTLIHKGVEGDTLILPQSYSAVDDSNDLFTFEVGPDGWYEVTMKLIPIDVGQAVSEGEAVFVVAGLEEPYGGHIEKVVDGERVTIETDELDTFTATNAIESLVYNDGFAIQAIRAFNKCMRILGYWQMGVGKIDKAKAIRLLNHMWIAMDTFGNAMRIGHFHNARRIAARNYVFIEEVDKIEQEL